MMKALQVRELQAMGMEVGAQTVTHPILAALDVTAARAEIFDSRYTLADHSVCLSERHVWARLRGARCRSGT